MTIVSIQYKAKNIRAPLLVKGIGLWSLHANKGFQNGLCGRAQQLIVPPYRITPFNAPFFKGGRRENAVKWTGNSQPIAYLNHANLVKGSKSWHLNRTQGAPAKCSINGFITIKKPNTKQTKSKGLSTAMPHWMEAIHRKSCWWQGTARGQWGDQDQWSRKRAEPLWNKGQDVTSHLGRTGCSLYWGCT